MHRSFPAGFNRYRMWCARPSTRLRSDSKVGVSFVKWSRRQRRISRLGGSVRSIPRLPSKRFERGYAITVCLIDAVCEENGGCRTRLARDRFPNRRQRWTPHCCRSNDRSTRRWGTAQKRDGGQFRLRPVSRISIGKKVSYEQNRIARIFSVELSSLRRSGWPTPDDWALIDANDMNELGRAIPGAFDRCVRASQNVLHFV